jgi:hypothetical protein
MKDFDALKNIWHSQLVPLKLNYEDVLKGIKKSTNSFANKLLFEIMAMVAAIALFLYIWVVTPSMMWTTHLSLLIFILCCAYYLVTQLIDLKSLSNHEYLLKEPGEYIAYLKAYKRKRYLFNTRKYAIYSIFIGVAFGLYFVEIYFTSPLWQTTAGAIAVAAWFVICWYFMKAYISKEQGKLNEMIYSLEKLESQLREG